MDTTTALLYAGGTLLGTAVAGFLFVICLTNRYIRFLLPFAALFLLLYGISGFVVGEFISYGGSNELKNDMEWPVGIAWDIVQLENGTYVVPLPHIGRIQLYTPEKKFIRAIQLRGFNGIFNLYTYGNEFEVITARSNMRYRYDQNGKQLSAQKIEDRYHKKPSGQKTLRMHLKTPWYLYAYTSPFIGFAFFMAGFCALGICTVGANKKKAAAAHQH